VSLGGELNNTSCLLLGDKAFISQHIGDVENIETQSFLTDAIEHLQRLTNCNAEVVACDLHPKFTTTSLAKEMAETHRLPLVQVQHHHAHAAALMAENSLDEIVAITCDGYGFGSDGKAWGGEILHCAQGSKEFRRLAHLQPQLLLGGDLASRYPLRFTAAMLSKADVDAESWLLKNSDHLPHGAVEAQIIVDQLKSGMGIETTSCGRVLDAISALLGLCDVRSYEGEPAIKLESAAVIGKDTLNLKPQISGGILDTTELVRAVFDSLGKVSVADLAYSAHAYLAQGLAALAVEKAALLGVRTVGFTGGAACNQILATLMRQTVELADLRFVLHEAVPAGDGGVSFGQAIVAGFGDL
jgi:hydrogenase maturation protein HypF